MSFYNLLIFCCLSQNDHYYKTFKPEWAKAYLSIHIIDDSPNVWLETEPYKNQIEFFIPKEFRGEINDTELLDITKRLQLKKG